MYYNVYPHRLNGPVESLKFNQTYAEITNLELEVNSIINSIDEDLQSILNRIAMGNIYATKAFSDAFSDAFA